MSIVGQRETVTRERHRKMKAERTTEKDRTRFKTMKKHTWFVQRETERDSDARKRKRDEARENDRERQRKTEKDKEIQAICR